MAAEATTIARPYAEAVFARAVETDTLDLWSDMLGLLAMAAMDPALSGLIASPKLDKSISSMNFSSLVFGMRGGAVAIMRS